jgi:hypothetical protein
MKVSSILLVTRKIDMRIGGLVQEIECLSSKHRSIMRKHITPSSLGQTHIHKIIITTTIIATISLTAASDDKDEDQEHKGSTTHQKDHSP